MIIKSNKFKLLFAFWHCKKKKKLHISLAFGFLHKVIMTLHLLIMIALLYHKELDFFKSYMIIIVHHNKSEE